MRPRYFSALACALLAIGLLAPVSSAPAAAAADCESVAILTFRGSGEKNVSESATTLAGSRQTYGSGALVTNGWEGPTIRRLLHSFANATSSSWPSGFDPEGIPVLGVGYNGTTGYPAIPPPVDLNKLLASAGDGSRYATKVMSNFERNQPRGCVTKYIATGYSQGAMAARLAAQLDDSIVGVINFGDPMQMPNARGNEGDVDGEGIVRADMRPVKKAILDRFYDTVDFHSALCHERDPICSFGEWGVFPILAQQVPSHTNYLQGDEASRKGKELADLAASLWRGEFTPPPAPRKSMDMVFAIDTTGSMGSYISAARDTARSAAAAVFSAASDGRVGLVEYRDHGDAYVARTVVPLTSDADMFYDGLNSLYASGGGDTPEAVISGVFEAARTSWTPTGSRSIVIIGDAPGHDPEPVTGYTFSQMARVLSGIAPVPTSPSTRMLPQTPGEESDRSQPPSDRANDGDETDEAKRTYNTDGSEVLPTGPVSISAEEAATSGPPIALYGISASSDLTSQLAPVSELTGGQVTSIDSPDEISDLILDAIEDASSVPEAVLTYAGVPTATLPVILSGANSVVYDGEPVFEFDFDGDGVFDISSNDSSVEHVFDTPGTYEVTLRLTDGGGRSATTSMLLEVVGYEEGVVQYPDPKDSSTQLHGVALSSPIVAPGKPSVLAVVDPLEPGERVGVRLVPSGSPEPWMAEAAIAFEVPVTGIVASAKISASTDLPPGKYDVLVFTDRLRHATLSLEVRGRGAGAVLPWVGSGHGLTCPNSSWGGYGSSRYGACSRIPR